MKGLITVFFALIFLTSCEKKRVPAGVIKEDEMVNLLADIHIADGYSNSTVHDTLLKYGPAIYSSILTKYRTDSAGFDKSFKYYSADPDKLIALYERVKSRLQRIEKAEQKRAEKVAKKVKTV